MYFIGMVLADKGVTNVSKAPLLAKQVFEALTADERIFSAFTDETNAEIKFAMIDGFMNRPDILLIFQEDITAGDIGEASTVKPGNNSEFIVNSSVFRDKVEASNSIREVLSIKMQLSFPVFLDLATSLAKAGISDKDVKDMLKMGTTMVTESNLLSQKCMAEIDITVITAILPDMKQVFEKLIPPGTVIDIVYFRFYNEHARVVACTH
jgi:hypothetical protein